MNPAVEKKWSEIRDSIEKEVANAPDVVVRIPRWQPVDLEQGLSWLKSTIYEGYYVAFRVSRSGSKTTVWLKSWEFGEQEPGWSS